jgi:hypothetical protein
MISGSCIGILPSYYLDLYSVHLGYLVSFRLERPLSYCTDLVYVGHLLHGGF